MNPRRPRTITDGSRSRRYWNINHEEHNMNENIKALLEKVSGDEELLAKFSACSSVDDAFELAKGIVGGFTKEEFVEAMTALNAADAGDISDEDLAAAAGGEGEEAPKTAQETMMISASISMLTNEVTKSAKDVLSTVTETVTQVTESVVDTASVASKASIKYTVKSAQEVSDSIVGTAKKVSKALSV